MAHALLQGRLPRPFPFCPSPPLDFLLSALLSLPQSLSIFPFSCLPLECSPTTVTLVSSLLTSHQQPLRSNFRLLSNPLWVVLNFWAVSPRTWLKPSEGPGPTGSCWNDPSVNTWPVGFKCGPWNCVASVWTQTSPLHLGNLPSISEDQLSCAKQRCCAK